jgi:energy-coupling factor transporter ATP-binding protein EcfA2
MVEQQATDTQTVHALLPRWANNQDGWVRAIVTDVLKTRVQASSADSDRYLKLLLAEKKLSDEQFDPVPKIEEKQPAGSSLEPIQIDSIKIGSGVNAIKVGAEIEFAPGVTVIFGENGSGKSGFVRVLKRAAGARAAEEILNNVRASMKSSPTGTFVVTTGAAQKTVTWKNEFGLAPLNRTSIFDARGARIHVEDDLTYVYTPGELTLFPLVQNGVERVRTSLERSIGSRTPGANTLTVSFDRACSIYPTIETLGSATDIDEIKKYAVLPDNVDGAIEALKLEVDALRSPNVQNDLKRSRGRAAVVQSLKSAIDAAAAFEVTKYEELINKRADASRRRDEASSKAFDGVAIPGVLSGEWQGFIQAGEDYLRKHLGEEYPHSSQPCAYCRQPLTVSAVALIKKYRDFTNSEIRKALDLLELELREYIKPVTDIRTDVLLEQIATEASVDTDVLASLAQVVTEIAKLSVAAKSHATVEWKDKDSALASAMRVATEEEQRLVALGGELQTTFDKRQEALKKKQTELIELQGKKTASLLLPQIEKRVSDAKWVTRATVYKNIISTGVLRPLTETAKQASEELLNKGFGKRFQEECKALRAPSVTLNFPGREGQVKRQKMVGAYRPNQVLSEGELKALALADFLAEVTAVPASSPVVFDDPITSMDYRRMREVCDRLIHLADDHQVIVFTHNIWFAAEMLSKAEKKKWKYYDIRSESGDAGVVTAAIHPRVDTPAQVSGRIRKMIEAADKAEGEVKAALVEKGYEELRNLCEITVEHEMFKGVVQRYYPNVMMTRLEKVNIAKLQETKATVTPIFEKCCRYIASHSQPIETQGIRPTLSELRADYEAVLKAREPHKE